MWAQVNELLFKKYFGTHPVTPLHNLYPSKPIFTRPKDGWTGGWLSAWPRLRVWPMYRHSPTLLYSVLRAFEVYSVRLMVLAMNFSLEWFFSFYFCYTL